MKGYSQSIVRGPGKRSLTSRNRKSLRLDLRMECYARLTELPTLRDDGRPEPLVTVIERLIMAASETPKLPWERKEFVRPIVPKRERVA